MQAPTDAEQCGQEKRWLTPICLGLAVITLSAFAPALWNQFVNYDDNLYVYDNPMVKKGLTSKGIIRAFTHNHAFNWHPVTWLSHMVDCQVYGLHPWGHHLTNVLVHTAAVLALFLALRELTGALWRSAAVAAIFAVHPLRVESVAWVSERKDVLSGLFFFLTIWAYARYARDPAGKWRYGLVLALFALGLMCKPMLVTLPLVLLLLDYWPLRRSERLEQLIVEKLPLLGLAVGGCLTTLMAQERVMYFTGQFSLSSRLANAAVSCVVYLRQMIWPSGLAVLYPFPHATPLWEAALATLLLAAVSMTAWLRRRDQPWLWIGWLWYLLMLLPVLGIIQVGRQAHADRYTYLPQIGDYMAVIWWAAQWPMRRVVFALLAAAAVAAMMFCTWRQIGFWHDSQTLWTRTLACTTDNDMAHYDLGVAVGAEGRSKEAVSQFRQALAINPDLVQALSGLGGKLVSEGKFDEAISNCQRALKLLPDFVEARLNLGDALTAAGRTNDAIVQYQAALRLDPSNLQVQNNLAAVLRPLTNLDDAVAQYQKALEVVPNNVQLRAGLGSDYLQQGREDLTIVQFSKALEINPGDIEMQNKLAFLLATSPDASLRNGARAVQLARAANDKTGQNNPVILGTLAAALAETGQFAEAASTARLAQALAEAGGKAALADRLQDQLQLYEANRPFHRP